MYLIVGLGNPGKQYENTRHNVGFEVVDAMTSGLGWENKYQSLMVKTQDLIFAKPQTFMNLSGKAVKDILKFYPDAQLVVVHDELDLPLGTIRIMKDSGAAGHNGIKSIIEELGTQNFIRIRVGINNEGTRGQTPAEDFVLQKFGSSEEDQIKISIQRAKDAAETLIREGLEQAQSRFNG